MAESTSHAAIDYQMVMESAPDLYLLLSPGLIIIGASDAYLTATLTKREDVMGRHLFEVFPDNPGDPNADGVRNLKASLDFVLQHRTHHKMAIQKYDIRTPDGVFEERFWSPLNKPVLDANGNVCYVIHRVEDVTELEDLRDVTLQQQVKYNELQALHKGQEILLKKTEDHFFAIFNLSPIALSMTDVVSSTYIYVNKAFEELFKMDAATIIGRTAFELGITNSAQRSETLKKMFESGGRVFGLESELGAADGSRVQVLVSIELIEFDYSNYLLSSIVDITARRSMEDELRKTNEFLDTILENIPNMIFVKDAEHLRFLRVNKAGEQLIGLTEEELLGKNDFDFFPQEQAEFFVNADRLVLENRTLLNIEEEPIQTASGQRWLHTQKIPVVENGKTLYLVGISEDITEYKKQKDAVNRLNKELESFTYTVSHDLRAPLRAINGYSKMLLEDYHKHLDTEGKRLLDVICSNAERMGKLIDELLSFSRLGKKELKKTDTDLEKIVSGLIHELTLFGYHNAKFKVDPLPVIQADPVLMKQVLTNLISNALKYSSKSNEPLVKIGCEHKGENFVFSISDNGVGFDMRYVHKLFNVFQRLHTNDEFEGTGVGLAIVQRIIHKHGGTVWATAKQNEGATFYFSIPHQ